MSGGGDDMATLALALLKRGASPREVLDAMGEGGPAEPARPGFRRAAARAERAASNARPVNHAMVLAALRDAPGPLTARELVARVPLLTNAAALRHMYRGIEIGTVVQHGKEKPHSYSASKTGIKAAHVEGTPSPAAVEGGLVSHDALVAWIGRARSATMATLREAFPHATRTALYQHLSRGIADGELKRAGTGQRIVYSLKGAARAKQKRDAVAGSSPAPKGARIEEIGAVIRKAGRPLGCGEIGALMPHITSGNVTQHLLVGVRKGVFFRVGNERPYKYALKPAKGIPADGRRAGAPKKDPVGLDAFMVTFRKCVTGPLAVKDIYKFFPAMHRHSVDTAIARCLRAGTILRFGKKKPYTYRPKPEPPAAAALNGSATNGAPVALA